jgi:hypothetical protein
VLVHIVEEVLDEWIARTMVHYRWHYDRNVQYMIGLATGEEVSLEEARKHQIANWGLRACRATGTEALPQQRAAEKEYEGILAALEAQLATTRFAMGDRPTVVDAILLGGLRAHTNSDPACIETVAAFPTVARWSEEATNAVGGDGELPGFPQSTPFAEHVLELARTQYRPFVLGNAGALARKERAFVAETYGEEVSYLARAYPEQSRRMIAERIEAQLEESERGEVIAWLEERGLADCFAPQR